MREIYLQNIHECFRILQQRNRYVGELRLAEAHALIEIQIHKNKPSGYIQEILGIEQSVFSKLVKSLLNRGLIKIEYASNDKRVKFLKLTSSGESTVSKIDKNADSILRELFSILTKQETNTIIDVSMLLIRSYGIKPSTPRSHEHFFRPIQRGLTRCFHLIKQKYMGSDLAPSHWHVLSEINSHPQGGHVKHLTTTLGITNTHCAQIVSELKNKEFIIANRGATDQRSSVYYISEKGSSILRAINRTAQREYKIKMSTLSDRQLFNFLSAMEKLVLRYQRTYPNGRYAKHLTNQEDKQQGRAYIIKRLSSISIPKNKIPAHLISETCLAVALYHNNKIVALYQKELAISDSDSDLLLYNKPLTTLDGNNFKKLCHQMLSNDISV